MLKSPIPKLSIFVFLIFFTKLTIAGNFNSEKLIAHELGYRHQLFSQPSIDIASFVNGYSQLRDFSLGTLSLSTGLPNQLLLPATTNNNASAIITYGFEISTDWRLVGHWCLQDNCNDLNLHISSNELLKQSDPSTSKADKATQHQQLSARSNYVTC